MKKQKNNIKTISQNHKNGFFSRKLHIFLYNKSRGELMNLLIADDEILIREVVKEYALHEGYQIFEANNGEEALEIIEKEIIDCIILDIMMPKLDGISMLKQMKKTKNIPTIILSARGDEYDKLSGFDLGIDDYLTKPFSPKELMARIKAILKRCNKIEEDIYTYQDLTINRKAHTVTLEGTELSITPKEYELLLYFIQNQNVALSREQLLSKIWGYDFFGDDRTIDTHIKMLRNNLGKYRDLIVTVRGMGYKFVIPEK